MANKVGRPSITERLDAMEARIDAKFDAFMARVSGDTKQETVPTPAQSRPANTTQTLKPGASRVISQEGSVRVIEYAGKRNGIVRRYLALGLRSMGSEVWLYMDDNANHGMAQNLRDAIKLLS